MPDFRPLADSLAQALRSTPDRCSRDYDMKAVKVCARCRSLAEYDRAVAEAQIIQRTRYHANCSTCACSEPGESKA